MKISKVDHIKSAISVDQDSQKGILYKNLNDGKNVADIGRHIDKLVDKAERGFGSKFKYSVSDSLSNEDKKKAQQKKDRFKENVKKSIENKNMLIQPVQIDDEFVLALSMVQGGEGANVLSRKAREKSAFSRFLFDYANLDEEYRMDKLRRIRRIVLVYFYGPDALDDEIKGAFSVWDDHKKRQGDTAKFIEHTFPELKQKYDKKEEEENYKLLADTIRTTNIKSYRATENFVKAAMSEDGSDLFFDDIDLNAFWIHHIESEVERIYAKTKRFNRNNTYKFGRGYICEKVWKGIINYICIKYIAIGKAVFNVAMEDVTSDGDENLGVVAEPYKMGISSFDYEVIKAEERLQRETAVYTTFAINSFLTATVEIDNEHYDIGDKELKVLPCAKKNILQYYGGQSRWNDFDFDSMSDGDSDEYLWSQIKSILESMRNESFHFKTKNYRCDWDKKLISEMFKADSKACGKTEVTRFYSNNIPMFYAVKDIEKLMYKLYDEYTVRASQVPAFNTVFVRKNFPDFIKNEMHINTSFSLDDTEKYQSALYYLLKEIYYNLFLTDKASKSEFLSAVRNMKGADKKQVFATKDFQARIKEINESRDYSLSEICQLIMTEYNQQNDKWMKKRTNKAQKNRPDGYQHYKVLLLEGLRKAFLSYIDKDEQLFGFIKKPLLREKLAETDFLPHFSTKRYNELIEELQTETELQKWYVTGRLLTPKQVNHLSGCFKNYIQYKWDIERRSESTGNRLTVSDEEVILYKKILQVLEICTMLSGCISNMVSDYFEDEDDYARYLAGFLDYESSLGDYSVSPSGMLKEFCRTSVDSSDDETINIYYDGENPILQRNIVLSKLYGNGQIISDVLKANRVNVGDIQEYYRSKDKLTAYKTTGTYNSIDELKEIKKYQELKNHVEFIDIVEYTEILNELQGQLVNYTFLRERDLLYFQLGFHFSCLKNDSYKPGEYVRIEAGDKVISNAILHQIASLYINGISLYIKDEAGTYVKDKDKSAGGNIRVFFKYCKNTFTEYSDSQTVYSAGLELFENLDEHGQIIDLRKYIDHFKYYISDKSVNSGRSMIDIYSEVFDRFFTYDLKYHKNIPNTLYNILMGHFIETNFDFSTGTKAIEKDKKLVKKNRASLKITKVSSEPFTYKVQGKKVECPAKSEKFLRNVISLLYYREINTPDIIYREGTIKNAEPDNKGKNGIKNKRDKSKNHKKERNNNHKTEKLSSNPFDSLLDDFLL